MGARVAVAGATGYAGGELLRVLAAHPDIEVAGVTGHGAAGAALGEVHPQLRSLAHLTVAPTQPDTLADADLVFLALPHGHSGPLATALDPAVKVVDLGADHRLRSATAWADHYGGPHAGPWPYGLPELPGARDVIATAPRVAAPGCYATAVVLALAPLVAAGIADPEDVVVVAASGTSGAGRAAKAHLLGAEVMGDVTAYRVGAHQHVPEIKQATGATTLCMTPLLAPMPRGILATVTARVAAGATASDAEGALTQAYQQEAFVHVLTATQPRTAATLGSNACHLAVRTDRDSGRIVVTAALDNLGKGAAGQAVQCANLMLGLAETAGLSADGMAP